jgi:hypothetical protein
MKGIKCVIFAFWLLPAYSQTISRDALIGRVYKKINEIRALKNYQEEEGDLIAPVENNYCFSRISDKKNTMVLFTKYLPVGHYKILAVLDLGVLNKNTSLVISLCRVNTKNDGEIVALVKPTNKPLFKTIIKAWKPDEKTHKFIPISVKGIDCVNEGEDAD